MIESQIESAGTKTGEGRPGEPLTQAQIELLRKKESLTLSRTRVLHELESAANPRYTDLLRLALNDLNAKLAEFD